MIATGNRTKEGVGSEWAEIEGEALEVIVVNALIGKDQHVVLKPGIPKPSDLVLMERCREINTRDSGPAGLA